MKADSCLSSLYGTLHMAAHTHIGTVRSNNEDCVYCDAELGLALVADGMGGHNAGEVASALASAKIVTFFRQKKIELDEIRFESKIKEIIINSIQEASRDIFLAANDTPSYHGMGTTLVMGVFHMHKVWLAHVGDSRAYRFRNGALLQLTNDHSILQEYIDCGLLTNIQAKKLNIKNVITQALGMTKIINIDVKIDTIDNEDVYLFCSDGLTDMLSDLQIRSVLLSGDSLQQKVDTLIAAACTAGGRDNISVVLVCKSAAGVG
jgi:PPM family protein phosphatase